MYPKMEEKFLSYCKKCDTVYMLREPRKHAKNKTETVHVTNQNVLLNNASASSIKKKSLSKSSKKKTCSVSSSVTVSLSYKYIGKYSKYTFTL